MSISWSRIFPDGKGQPNPAGLDYYNRVIDELLANNITPYVTLFHWDLPAALPGGWQSRDTSKAFADYAAYIAKHLSDRVHHFMTTNEFVCFTDLGYKIGQFAPGLKLPAAEVNQVRHHGILAHGLGVQAIRANAPSGTQVGLAENANVFVPVIEDRRAHRSRTQRATRDRQRALPDHADGRQISRRVSAARRRQCAQSRARRHEGHRQPARFRRPQRLHADYVRADASRAGFRH